MVLRAGWSFVVAVLLTVGAFGQGAGNRTYFNEDIFVASGQQIHNATCFFCSVQVEGDVSGHVLVLFGSLNVSGQVKGGATVLWGNAVVDSQARIGGDTVVLVGNTVYEADESLSGNAYVVGGHLSHVARSSADQRPRSRVSLSPVISWLIAGVALLLLSAFIAQGVRRRVMVNQASSVGSF